MRRAISLSEEKMQAGEGGPFGAVIVRDGRIIAEGWNQVTTCNDPTAHAEIVAVRNACQFLQTFDLSGCVLYTSCEPCPMCFSAIYWAHLDKVFYGNTRHDAAAIGFDDHFIYEEIQKPIAAREISMDSLLQEESQHAFDLWKKKIDKTEY